MGGAFHDGAQIDDTHFFEAEAENRRCIILDSAPKLSSRFGPEAATRAARRLRTLVPAYVAIISSAGLPH
jgi:hypothetical protein